MSSILKRHAWHVCATAQLPGGISGPFAAVTAIPGTKQLWAVGQTLKFPRPSFEQALIELWDGRQWHLTSSPTVPNMSLTEVNALTADRARNFWAVGDSISETEIPQFSTFTEHSFKCA